MTNDEKILDLKKKIAEKKEKLKGSERFVPHTNCLLNFNNTAINLNTQTKEQLTLLLVQLHTLQVSAFQLDVELVFGMWNVETWIKDIKAKIAVLDRTSELEKLRKMETTLDGLLSQDKTIELKLKEFENDL